MRENSEPKERGVSRTRLVGVLEDGAAVASCEACRRAAARDASAAAAEEEDEEGERVGVLAANVVPDPLDGRGTVGASDGDGVEATEDNDDD